MNEAGRGGAGAEMGRGLGLGSSLRRRRGRRLGERGTPAGTPPPAGPLPGGARVWGAALILAAVGLAGGYLLATRVFFPVPPVPRELVAVPDFRGRERTEAQEEIRRSGLALAAVDFVRHPVVEEGRVVGQSPVPGQLSVPGGEVRLTLSLGPERGPVPDVVRLRRDRARTILEATGFSVLEDSLEADAPAGTVVAVRPAAGTEVALPAEVSLSVSLGPPLVTMPDLVGLTEVEVKAVLDSLGLVLGTVESRFRFGLDQGVVIEQVPPPETPMERGSAVRIVVGAGG